MKLSRLGLGALAMTALALVVAGSTGNNLLYLVYGAQVGLLLAAATGAWMLRRVDVEVEAPTQAFQGQACTIKVRLTNNGWMAAYGIEAMWQDSRAMVIRIPRGEGVVVELRGTLAHRGLNELTDLAIETSFPFALFRFRRRLAPPSIVALPVPGQIRESREISDLARPSGRPSIHKGSGEELYGVRDFAPGDDARVLNWKLSARAGRPLVNERCASRDDRVTVAVDAARGQEGERAVARAAAACRFHIDAGAEVRLESPEETIDYGRGLAQLDRLLGALARLGDGRAGRRNGAAPKLAAPPELDSPVLRGLTMVCLAAAFAGLFLVDEVDPRTLLVLSPLVLLGWLVQSRGWRLLPALAWNALSLAVLGWTVGHEWRTLGVTVANVHLLIYLLLNRALTPLRGRELRQAFLISLLAFFLTSGLTISLWYFPLFIAYAALSGAWLFAAGGLPWEHRGRWRGGLARSLGLAAALAAALFTLTPRVEGLRRINPFLAAGLDKLSVPGGSVTAFTEDVSLGFFGRIRKSSVRVMRVKPVGLPPGAVPAPIYVRGSAFDYFDGMKWSRSGDGRRFSVERAAAALRFPAAKGVAGQTDYDILIYPMSLDVLFTVGTPWLVTDSPEPASYDATDTIRFASPYHGGAHYVVHPSVDGGLRLERWAGKAALSRYLQLPPDPGGKLAALARRVTAKAPDPLGKAMAVRKFLRGHYGYSLYSERPATLDDFLFKGRSGNCEYFATAAVVLLRQAGIPARLASGFLSEDWNEYGKFFDVRQSDAHAWVEVFVPGRGWTTVDPTPPQGALWTGAQELSRQLAHWFSSLETGWYRHVIGYDQYVQRDALHRLGASFSRAEARRLARRLARRGAAAGLLLCAPWLVLLGWRRARSWLSAPPRSLFEQAQELAARAGHARQAAWTEREYAAAVVAARPGLAALAELAELRYRERFRPGGLGAEELARGASLLAELRLAAKNDLRS